MVSGSDLIQTAPSQASVRDVMSPGIIAISSDTTVAACAATMYARRTHAVLVVDSSTRLPKGWVFHKDILRYLRTDPLTTVAGDIVSEQAHSIDPSASVEEAAERMVGDDITHLLVSGHEDAIPDGVISTWDIVAFYARGHSLAP